MKDATIIAHADKSILKIEGLKVSGFKPHELEALLTNRLETLVRVIGVTGESIEMDVYGLDPDQIMKDEEGIVTAVSAVKGVEATEIVRMEKARKAIPVNIADIPLKNPGGCAKERWLSHD